MRKFLILSLFSSGIIYAEYNIGDTLTVPINAFYLTLVRDYVQSDPLVSNYRFWGKVRYKSNKYYIITIDTIKYDYSSGQPAVPTTRTDTIPQAYIDDIVDSLREVIDNYNIFQRVLDSLGVSEFELFDSDNDPRIYIVVAAGFYLTSQNTALNIEDEIRGYFDPYYSTSSIYPRHEYFVLNYKSSLFTNTQTGQPDIKKDLIRKYLFYLYTQYVLWSVNRGDNEDVADILKGAFYLASRIDKGNIFDYYQGFKRSDTLKTANFDPLGLRSSYLKTVYIMQTSEALASILWFSNLEDELGYNTIKSFLLNKGETFSNLLNNELQIKNISLNELIVSFHLKNQLNRFGNAFEYHYNQPFLQGVPIYALGVNANLAPSINSITLSSGGAFGLRAPIASIANKPTVINYSDLLYERGLVRIYKIDTVAKSIIRVDSSIRAYLKNGIAARDSQWLFIMNLSSAAQVFYYAINDTLGPSISKFSLVPDRFALNIMHIYIQSNENIHSDINQKVLNVVLKYPNGIEDTFLISRTDSFALGNSVRIFYNYNYTLPYLLPGWYVLRTYRANDILDNPTTTYRDSIQIAYLNANSLLSYYDNSIILLNPTNSSYRFALKFEDKAIGITSNEKFKLILKIKGSGIICKKDGPCLETYRDGDYVYSYIDDNGYYVLSSGNPYNNFLFNIVNKRLSLSADDIVKIDVYSLNGRKVYSADLTSGIYELPIKSGIYKAILNYKNSKHEKVFVVY